MAGYTDLSKTFYELQDTWSKVRADVFSHLVAGGVIFGILGVSFPTVQLPTINPTAVMEDPLFKLLKETGFVFVFPLVPVIPIRFMPSKGRR